MKAKREALKNLNPETAAMLVCIQNVTRFVYVIVIGRLTQSSVVIFQKKIKAGGDQRGKFGGSDSTDGKLSSFSFAAPQLNLSNNASSNNMFGKQPFGMQSSGTPFGAAFGSPSNATMYSNAHASSFISQSAFGGNLAFGGTTNTGSSIFGGVPTTNTSTFSSVQNPPFGTAAPQTIPMFGGGRSQGMFGQSGMFGGAAQSTYDGNTTSTTLFNNPATSEASNPLFSGAQNTGANLFGGSSTQTQANPVFGGTASPGPFNTGMFNQSKAVPAFGGTPVFGGVTNYAGGNSGSLFSTTAQTFGTPPISMNSSIFGGAGANATSAFGTSAVTMASAFGGAPPAFGVVQPSAFGTTVSTANVFGGGTQGPVISASSGTPFGAPSAAAIGNPFGGAGSFGSTGTTTIFGLPACTNDAFGTAVTSSAPLFTNAGTTFASSAQNSPFTAPAFGGHNASPFNATTLAANPFAPQIRQSVSPFAATFTDLGFDEASAYTPHNQLTEVEKRAFMADEFEFGKIPLNAPSRELA